MLIHEHNHLVKLYRSRGTAQSHLIGIVKCLTCTHVSRCSSYDGISQDLARVSSARTTSLSFDLKESLRSSLECFQGLFSNPNESGFFVQQIQKESLKSAKSSNFHALWCPRSIEVIRWWRTSFRNDQYNYCLISFLSRKCNTCSSARVCVCVHACAGARV